MGLSRLNIWVSDVADACGTWKGDGLATILDCKGVLEWPCGRYLAPDGTTWVSVPNGSYRNLPFRCGHLEVELPPGCYWAVAGYVTPSPNFIHLNYTTHVGVVEVCCGETACVKLFNPSARLCWNWFLVGLRMMAAHGSLGHLAPGRIEELQTTVENEFFQNTSHLPIERVLDRVFDELVQIKQAPPPPKAS